MHKVGLLLNELNNIRNIGLVKTFIIELIILFLAFGVFFTDISMLTQIGIFGILSVIFIVIIFLSVFKQRFIDFCRENYLDNPDAVIEYFAKRKKYHLDIIDYVDERLLFKEIERTLSTYKNYGDETKIGPWGIIYDYQKTKKFYDNLKFNDKFAEKTAGFPEEFQELFKELGINYRKVFDIWKFRNSFELMYPVFGLIINDSQVLRHGLKYGEYKFSDNFSLKPYERKLDGDDVIMLHIKLK